jgi:hypothetical protein
MDINIEIQTATFISICFAHKQQLFWKYFHLFTLITCFGMIA